MNQEMSHYQQLYDKAQTIDLPWLNQLRDKAWQEFQQQGFPSRKYEEWKYTDVSSLVNLSFNGVNIDEAQSKTQDYGDDALVITIHQGQAISLDTVKKGLPDGVIVETLNIALKEHAELVKNHLGQVANNQDNGFIALNTAMLDCGLFIFVPENCVLDKTLVIEHQGCDGLSQQVRHLIVAEKNAELSVLEAYLGQGCYFNNCVTEVVAMDNAIVTHYKLQQESIEAYHIGSVYGQLSKSAQLYSHSFSFGGRLVRSDTLVSFEEQGGHCGMNGLYLVGDHQHVDHHTTAFHKVPHCTSDEFYKGILNGNSRAVFNGKVVVAQDAQKTNASQQNKNLLLSKQAEVDTKPQLEIYADDVKCAHGATVGQLDEDALFYLQSRGLNPEQAKEFLLTAFVADRIEQVKFKGLKQRLTDLMHAQRNV